MKNYVDIYSCIPWVKKFMYIDTRDYLADALFAEKRIPMKFKGEFVKSGCKYIIVSASCPKKYWEVVLSALRELPDKMLLLGNTDYEDMCNTLMNMLREGTINKL